MGEHAPLGADAVIETSGSPLRIREQARRGRTRSVRRNRRRVPVAGQIEARIALSIPEGAAVHHSRPSSCAVATNRLHDSSGITGQPSLSGAQLRGFCQPRSGTISPNRGGNMGKGRRVRARRHAEADSALRVAATAQHEWAYPAGAWEPRPHRPCDELRALAATRERARRALLDVEIAIDEVARRERTDGASWVEIGAALGTSRQAARQRFGTGE
jgi:hypothetical protein